MKLVPLVLGCVVAGTGAQAATGNVKYTETFAVEKSDFAAVGTNRFFNLIPGFQLVLEGKHAGKTTVLTLSVLDQTKLVDGVETRVVEEKETVNGELVEVSRNYFAISKQTSDVFYFGEDVDMYKGGKITSHEGAWLSGIGGAKYGLAMPGTPLLGARYYQEVAPKVALDRAEVVSLSTRIKTPAGLFAQCLETEESSALESGRERKVYAPGIGLVSDDELKLTKWSPAEMGK